MDHAPHFVPALRAAAPYVHAHVGKVFVFAFGGEICQRGDFDRLLFDLALLQSLGVKPVLVHGSRPQIDALLAAGGHPSRMVGDHRVTDGTTLACVKAAAGSLRMDIEAKLSTSLASTPMGGARIKVAGGNWVVARPIGVVDGIDLEHTGTVRRVDAQSIKEALDAGRIALVSHLGYSPTGETFNLRYEDVAVQVAMALGADKLVLITPEDPRKALPPQSRADVGQFSLREASDYLQQLNGGAHNSLRTALQAALGGVARVHWLGADQEGAVLRELYTRDGSGVMLHSDEAYEAVREATIEDVGGILALIAPLEANGVLVPRSREQLELEIHHFDVMVRDGMVIACSAMFPYVQQRMGEFSCVAVHPDYRSTGRAKALLKRAEETARSQGLQKLFALTTTTEHWFVEQGFAEAKPDQLPQQKQRLYNYRRNSVVLVKRL